MTHSFRTFLVASAVLAVPVLFGAYACNSSNETRTKPVPRTTTETQAESAPKTTTPIVLTSAEQKTLEEFEKRANDYASLHDKLEGTLPSLSDKSAPAEIDKHQKQMAALIQTERKDAKTGEFFTPDTVALLKRIFGVSADATQESVMDENPGTLPSVGVNDKYPDGVPVASMPHELLDQLPKLPEKMEFRFLGKRLVLVDSGAALVLDITPNVMP